MQPTIPLETDADIGFVDEASLVGFVEILASSSILHRAR
jgi:hypothetical protein